MFLGTLEKGSRQVVFPYPAAYGERGRPTNGVHNGGGLAFPERAGDGVGNITDDAIIDLLAAGGEVAVEKLKSVKTFMSFSVGALADHEW